MDTISFASITFNNPWDVILDSSGSLFISDVNNNRIVKRTAAGTTSVFAAVTNPIGLCFAPDGNMYAVSAPEFPPDRVLKITPAGMVSTLAGGSRGFADGTGTAASFYLPLGIACDSSGNVFVADYANNRIRKVTSAGVVSTFAGSGVESSTDGTGTGATMNRPHDLAFDSSGNLLVTDTGATRSARYLPRVSSRLWRAQA